MDGKRERRRRGDEIIKLNLDSSHNITAMMCKGRTYLELRDLLAEQDGPQLAAVAVDLKLKIRMTSLQ